MMPIKSKSKTPKKSSKKTKKAKRLYFTQKRMKKLFTHLLTPTTRETKLKCDCGHNLQITQMVFGGPYNGSAHCPKCGYRDSLYSYFGKQMIEAQPLPDGAISQYYKGKGES